MNYILQIFIHTYMLDENRNNGKMSRMKRER